MDTGFPDFLPERLRYQRWLNSRDIPKREPGQCRWCGSPVQPPRRSWCGENCKNEFMIRCFASVLNSRIYERDHGICAVCGIDTIEIRRTSSHRLMTCYMPWQYAQWGPWNPEKRLWEADHIIPVVEGGGCCGLENYRTLCQPCHRRETAALAARRATNRAITSGRGVQSVMEGV